MRSDVQPLGMGSTSATNGIVVQAGVPNWAPLEAVVGRDLAGWFMWIYEIELADGSRIHAYKHMTTRRYLHLVSDGRAFEHHADGRYGEVGLASAIVRAFSGWERAQPPSRHRRAMRAAVESARRAA